MIVGEDVSIGRNTAYFRVKTWLSNDMIESREVLRPAGEGETPLGESWLVRTPFKEIEHVHGGARAAVYRDWLAKL